MSIKSEFVTVSIDEGAVLLVAEVLRLERREAKRNYKEAEEMITRAALSLRAGVH